MVLYFNKHGKGTSVHTFGTSGVGLNFVGSERNKASKYGQVTTKLFKQFAKRKTYNHNNKNKNKIKIHLENIGSVLKIGLLLKITLLGSARILCKVLGP